MEKKYYYNKTEDFREISSVTGELGKSKENIESNKFYILKRTDGKFLKLQKINTLLFVALKNRLFTFFYVLFVILFIISFPLYSIITIIFLALLLKTKQPYKNNKSIRNLLRKIKYTIFVATLVHLILIFTNPIYILHSNWIDLAIFETIFIYMTFFVLGLYYKYQNIYMYVEEYDEGESIDAATHFVWKGIDNE